MSLELPTKHGFWMERRTSRLANTCVDPSERDGAPVVECEIDVNVMTAAATQGIHLGQPFLISD
jgi:hypothetical protein